jgi:hypothetical protein
VNVSLSIDVRLTGANGSVLLGARLAGTTNSVGAILAVDASGSFNITASMSTVQSGPVLARGTLPAPLGVAQWHTLRLDANGTSPTVLNFWVDGAHAISNLALPSVGASGHTGVGTVQFGHYTEIDNVALFSTQVACSAAAPAAGAPIAAVSCASEVGPRPGGQLVFTPSADSPAPCTYGSPCAGATGTFSLASDTALCVAVTPGAAKEDWPLALAPCDATSPNQIFTQAYTMLYSSSILHTASNRRICLVAPDIGALAYAHENGPASQCGSFVYVGDEQEIVSINSMSVCLGTC